MSWWVYLEDADGPVSVDHFNEGGTYPLSGNDRAELNITYNYGGLFLAHGIEMQEEAGNIHGARAVDTIAMLKRAVDTLGTTRDDDYWKATPGNAGAALSIMLGWARRYPEATWRVS